MTLVTRLCAPTSGGRSSSIGGGRNGKLGAFERVCEFQEGAGDGLAPRLVHVLQDLLDIPPTRRRDLLDQPFSFWCQAQGQVAAVVLTLTATQQTPGYQTVDQSSRRRCVHPQSRRQITKSSLTVCGDHDKCAPLHQRDHALDRTERACG